MTMHFTRGTPGRLHGSLLCDVCVAQWDHLCSDEEVIAMAYRHSQTKVRRDGGCIPDITWGYHEQFKPPPVTINWQGKALQRNGGCCGGMGRHEQ